MAAVSGIDLFYIDGVGWWCDFSFLRAIFLLDLNFSTGTGTGTSF
eukprot:SAG31_NODE_694_length_12769_cov_8.102447_6_plen_45_part_00